MCKNEFELTPFFSCLELECFMIVILLWALKTEFQDMIKRVYLCVCASCRNVSIHDRLLHGSENQFNRWRVCVCVVFWFVRLLFFERMQLIEETMIKDMSQILLGLTRDLQLNAHCILFDSRRHLTIPTQNKAQTHGAHNNHQMNIDKKKTNQRSCSITVQLCCPEHILVQ